jgi:hypothetical protein
LTFSHAHYKFALIPKIVHQNVLLNQVYY